MFTSSLSLSCPQVSLFDKDSASRLAVFDRSKPSLRRLYEYLAPQSGPSGFQSAVPGGNCQGWACVFSENSSDLTYQVAT